MTDKELLKLIENRIKSSKRFSHENINTDCLDIIETLLKKYRTKQEKQENNMKIYCKDCVFFREYIIEINSVRTKRVPVCTNSSFFVVTEDSVYGSLARERRLKDDIDVSPNSDFSCQLFKSKNIH